MIFAISSGQKYTLLKIILFNNFSTLYIMIFNIIIIILKRIFFCFSGHSYPIWCMDTCAFNLYTVTGSHDRTAKLWSIDRTFPLRIFAGHFLDVNVCLHLLL